MNFISREELLEKLQEFSKDEMAIVDVRDQQDHGHGHLKNSIWIPFPLFHVKNYAFLDSFRIVIFHCMLSKYRAPKCAEKYFAVKSENQQVFILKDGFQGLMMDQIWVQNHLDLFQDYDSSYWHEENDQEEYYDPCAQELSCEGEDSEEIEQKD